MCGLSGYISVSGDKNLEQSLEAIAHRGPDASGIWRTHCDAAYLGLGHARLSILDLTENANQPFIKKNYTLVFNGEIYNYQEIRHELQQLGVHFKTQSDTEVILESYVAWGINCIARFEGMFAFVLVDIEKNEVILARDRLGIKPLYYCHNQDGIIFSSEIKGLAPLKEKAIRIDTNQFAEFFLNGWLYEPKTGFHEVEKIPPGHYFIYNLTENKLNNIEYFNSLEGPYLPQNPLNLITESYQLQSLADVKVGLFFSGGIDSSVLAIAAKGKIDGLFIKYDDIKGSEEAFFAEGIANHLDMSLETIPMHTPADNPQLILDEFRKVASATEEPISDFTFLATERIAAKARAQGYKVMLSGMGGDELFAGYPRYFLMKNRQVLALLSVFVKLLAPVLRKTSFLSKKLDRLLRFATQTNFFKAYTSLIGYYSPKEINRLLKNKQACESFWQWGEQTLKKINHLSPLKKALYLDRIGFLSHNLMVTDKASMLHAIEVRVPLLSNKLLDFSINAQDTSLIDNRNSKKPLLKILSQILPPSLLQKKKVGFNPPLDDKINCLGKDLILQTLNTGPIASICDMHLIHEIVNNHFSKTRNETYKIWQLIYFNFWLEHHA